MATKKATRAARVRGGRIRQAGRSEEGRQRFARANEAEIKKIQANRRAGGRAVPRSATITARRPAAGGGTLIEFTTKSGQRSATVVRGGSTGGRATAGKRGANKEAK